MRVRNLAANQLLRNMEIIKGTHRPIELLRYTGVFLWICAGIPIFLMKVIYPVPLELTEYIAWIMLHGMFGLMYWNLMRYLPERTYIGHRLLYLAILTGSALGISAVSHSLLGAFLLLIVAVLLPWMLSAVPALSWLIGQNVLLAITLNRLG